MKKFLVILGMLALTISVALNDEAAAENGAALAVVKKRQAAMKDIGKNFGAIKAYIEDDKGTPQDVARHAQTISALAKKIPQLFPEGTGRGNLDDKVTRALPAIWRDWPKFEATSEALASESAKLAEVAKGGDKTVIARQFAATGKQGCGACHESFRGDKVE